LIDYDKELIDLKFYGNNQIVDLLIDCAMDWLIS